MSVITEEEVSIISPPSLVYPSLLSPRSFLQQENDLQQQQKTCIHFASQLIKLRSELRSPSYMRSSTFVLQQHKYRSSSYLSSIAAIEEQEISTTSSSRSLLQEQPPLPLSAEGRTHSFLNVLHLYSHKNLDCQQDESEIASTIVTSFSDEDEASQLTYMAEVLVRQKQQKRDNHFDHAKINHLALPPLFLPSSNKCDKKKKREKQWSLMAPNNYNYETATRSVSLQDRIDQIIQDESVNYKQMERKNGDSDKKGYSSLTLASQLLLYVSQQQQPKKEESQEGEELLVINKNKESSTSKEEEEGSLDQTKRQNLIVNCQQSKFINSIKVSLCCNNKNNEALRLIPSLSRDTNKSLFSSSSSSSTSSSSSYTNTTSDTSTAPASNAVLVTISPCSAAAASVARSKRTNIKQQQYLTRFSSSSSSLPHDGRQLLLRRFSNEK